jgi:aldehyde:ferredoxin oxidoreductase
MQPILTLDLTNGVFGRYIIPIEWEQTYLGGASLAARILYDTLTAELDALSERAPLLFLNGPLSGTAGPAVGRFVVCGKSPATGLWAEANCGGFWGPELRQAGFDGVWITGRAAAPTWLWIEDGKAELRDAAHLWGIDPYEVQTILQKNLGAKVRVAAIGMAGEAHIPFSSILCDHGRMAARTGLGAVMGAKKLKAIAVRGSGQVPVADRTRYFPLRSEANRQLRAENMSQVARELGTASVADYFDYLGSMPKKYFQSGVMEGVDGVSGSTMKETILTGASACHACVIACGRVVNLDGKDQPVKRKGPEYETIVGFGPNLLIKDLAAITRLGEWCDRYGMDTISASNIIGLAFTLYERGMITREQAGLELKWGDAAAVETLLHQMARREGFGAVLAEGARALAQRCGDEDLAVQVNGLEVAYHDPRAVSGMALSYLTSPRGACHNQSDYFLVEIGQVDPDLKLEFFDRQGGAEKAANVARHQDWRSVCNALVMCLFANISAADLVNLINAACGLDWNVDEMLRSGERAWTLKRVINLRLGLRRASERLPKLLLEPYAEGGAPGYTPDVAALLQAYYTARSWDPITGWPTPSLLQNLGMEWIKSEGDAP